MIEVAIIGGGLAGLYAARLLQEAGVNYVLIEARDRLGGRIFTVDDLGSPCEDGFDVGPSWFWPRMQPAIGELIAELGLATFTQNSEGDVVFERMSRERPHRYSGAAQEPQSMRLAGGTAALVRALARQVPANNLLMGTRVTATALSGHGIELTIASADGSRNKLVAAHVIAALPPRLFAAVAFTPPQDAPTLARWHDTPTWMAPHAKFFALYDRPFWRDAGLSGTAQSMVGPMVEMHDATTASGRPALFGFLGVAAAQRGLLGEVKLTRACLEQLARIFGDEARSPRATLIKDWAADPLTSTAADQASSGHVVPSDAPWVSGPWQQRLAMAGSECSPSEAGYLAGAIIAAKRAVTETLDKLR